MSGSAAEEGNRTAGPLRLDLSDTANAMRLVKNAYVIPPAASGKVSRFATSGVLDSDGNLVDQSISWWTSTSRVNHAPEMPKEAKRMPGRYIFGGILYGHFGHFIVESLSRIWALDAEGVEADGFLFTPKNLSFAEQSVLKQQNLGALLGARLPFFVAREPVQVDEIYVPAQGFGMGDLLEGTAAFRTFIEKHAGTSIEPMGEEKLYISRSALPRDRGSVLGEYKLEQYLQEEGYHIFHPQRARAEEQIARYKAARQIVAVDCSPVHMLAYVGNANQSAAIILRRSMEIGAYLARQLQIFKGMKAEEIRCLVDDWFPLPGNRPSRSSWGELDFGALHAKLLASGHIKGTTPWPSLTEDERAAELARLELMHGTTFQSYKQYLATKKRPPNAKPETA